MATGWPAETLPVLQRVDGVALSGATLLAEGREGVVFRIREPEGTALKVYFPDVLARKGTVLAAKIRPMVANPPEDRTRSQGHVSLAWPSAVALDAGGSFAGYVMPFIDTPLSVELQVMASPSDRRHGPRTPDWAAGFTWEHLLGVAVNLASITQALHDAGYVIGDFNGRDVLVARNALVTLVGCDSLQVPAPSPTGGPAFLCEVLRPEFTPPELLHADLARTVRAPSSDLFPLAVHIYQLLMEGRHPFAGIWHGPGDEPQREELAGQGLFAQAGDRRLTPQAGTPPFAILSPEVQALFFRAFVDGADRPAVRPSGAEWVRDLEALAATLVTCEAVEAHRYPAHLGGACPWCQLEEEAEEAARVAPVHPISLVTPTAAASVPPGAGGPRVPLLPYPSPPRPSRPLPGPSSGRPRSTSPVSGTVSLVGFRRPAGTWPASRKAPSSTRTLLRLAPAVIALAAVVVFQLHHPKGSSRTPVPVPSFAQLTAPAGTTVTVPGSATDPYGIRSIEVGILSTQAPPEPGQDAFAAPLTVCAGAKAIGGLPSTLDLGSQIAGSFTLDIAAPPGIPSRLSAGPDLPSSDYAQVALPSPIAAGACQQGSLLFLGSQNGVPAAVSYSESADVNVTWTMPATVPAATAATP